MKHSKVSPAFKQTTIAVYLYTATYLFMVVLGIHLNKIHLLDYNFIVIQFWIFYNLFFSVVLLWNLHNTIKDIYANEIGIGTNTSREMLKWQLKTTGIFVLLLLLMIVVIMQI